MAISPSRSLATLRPDLAGSLMEFDLQANAAAFVGLKIAPVLEVAVQAGNFGRIPIEELLKNRDDSRGNGGAYNRGGGRFEPDTFACVEHGYEEVVDDRESNIYASYFDSEVIAAGRARHIVLQNFEQRVITKVQAVSNTASASVSWSTKASAVPIDDMIGWMNTFFQLNGFWPNAFALSRQKFNKAINVQSLIDRMKTSSFNGGGPNPVEMNAMTFAQALNIPELIVAGAAQNTANNEQAAAAGTATIASAWPDRYALLFRKPVSNDPQEPCFMRTVHWGEDGSNIGGVIETYRDERVRGDVVRNRMDTDEHVFLSSAAMLIDLGVL